MTENNEEVKETTDSGSSPEETTAEESTESSEEVSEEQTADDSSEKTEKTPSEGTEEDSAEQSEQKAAGEATGADEEPRIPLEHLQNERQRRRQLEEELQSLKSTAPSETANTPQQEDRRKTLEQFKNQDGTFDIEAYDEYRDQKEQQSIEQHQKQLAENARIREEMAQDIKKSEEAYPELKKSQPLQDAVMAHAQRNGIKISQAADEVMAGVRQQTVQAKQEGKSEAKSELTQKEKAQTASTGQPSQKSQEQELRERMSSDDPRERDQAVTEWLKSKNKDAGIV